MLFIKLYYYLFFAFVYLLVGFCEVINWMAHPRFNWAPFHQLIDRIHLPSRQRLLFWTQHS